MKSVILLFLLSFFSANLFAQDAATNALLIEQRDALVATHTAALAAASADFKAKLATTEAERDAAKAELAELKQRISDVLQTQLAEELKTGDGPRAALIRDLIVEAGKSSAQLAYEAALKAKAEADAALAKAAAAAGQ